MQFHCVFFMTTFALHEMGRNYIQLLPIGAIVHSLRRCSTTK